MRYNRALAFVAVGSEKISVPLAVFTVRTAAQFKKFEVACTSYVPGVPVGWSIGVIGHFVEKE